MEIYKYLDGLYVLVIF